MSTEAVSVDNVLSAASRLKGKVQETPLLESVALNNMTGARILVKAECLQTAGSFKIRGALHRVLRTPCTHELFVLLVPCTSSA